MKILFIRILIIITFIYLPLYIACNNPNKREVNIKGNWQIATNANFFNDYDECFLGEEIEFLNRNYYIFKSNCNSEKPYGVINAGYYEHFEDTITFFNDYHSFIKNSSVKVISNNEIELSYLLLDTNQNTHSTGQIILRRKAD